MKRGGSDVSECVEGSERGFTGVCGNENGEKEMGIKNRDSRVCRS
jgi:hypothetical protein